MTERYHFENAAGQHAHYLGDTPLTGTSSVCKILAKPLTWWASGLAVQTFGVPDPKILTKRKRGTATQAEVAILESSLNSSLKYIKTMSLDDYIELIDQAYRAHATTLKEKASAGTDLHAELEKYVRDHMAGRFGLYPEQIQSFISWTEANVKRFLWAEGHCFSKVHWLGGICDVGYEHNDGHFGIIDFKSAKDAYPEHFFQIGGYDLQIAENGVFTADGELLYRLEQPISRYAVVPFGSADVQPRFYHSPETARKVFLAMLTIYQALPRD